MSKALPFRRTATSAVFMIFALAFGNAASAQDVTTTPFAAPPPADPVDVLSAYLRTLAASPRNYLALIGAGDAALQVGDPNAALGFFARAEKVDPRSGRAKAGLGAALVALERPDDALPLFGEAVALGVADADVARDRGLAYDLRGDPKRAQHDYALALQRAPNDETIRRYALSLGISGDTKQALGLLDPLLRKKDQSAWRARAFIMAMNGDVNGANGIARQVMPGNLANTMAPFLSRLATLNSADRAHAVNFGTMPSTGVAMASVEIGDPFRPVGGASSTSGTAGTSGSPGNGLIPAGDPFGPRPEDAKPTRVFEPYSTEPRRRPGGPVTVAALPATPVPKIEGTGIKPVQPAPVFPAAAAPGFSVAPVGPLPATPRLGSRLGARIAAVDPAKLPPEARGEGPPSVIVGSTTAFPEPKGTAGRPAPSASPAPLPEAVPLVTARVPERPAFETSPAKTAPPLPRPATVAPVSLPTPLPTPVPTPVPTSLPPSVVAPAPKPPVVAAAVSAPVIAPPPAPIVVAGPALPSSPVARAVPLIGPPAEGQIVVTQPPAILPPPPAPPSLAPLSPAPVSVAAPVTASVTATPTPPSVVAPAVIAPPQQPPSRLASVLEGIEPEVEGSAVALPTAAEIRATRRAALRKATEAKADAAALKAEKDAKAAKADADAQAAKNNPARLWVQIATGNNTRGLGTTWARIRDGNERSLSGRSAWSVPFRATNRLLVGPMKSPADARSLINALAKGGVAATTYSSDAGQDVARVSGK